MGVVPATPLAQNQIKIPLVTTQDRDLNLFQTQLGKALQPILANPINLGRLIQGVALINGQTIVPTGLNRQLQGWFTVRVRAQATIWDSQDSNTTVPQSLNTLILNSTAAVTVDLWVF